MRFPAGEQIQVLRPIAEIDEYSEEMTRWSFTNSKPVALGELVAVEPRSSEERVEVGRLSVYVGLVLYGPADISVTAKDRVIVRGQTYEVDGEIAVYRNPFTGTSAGSVINLKRVDG